MKAGIKYDDAEVAKALDRLAAAGKSLAPAMKQIAAALEDAAFDAFQTETSPDGDPWAGLSEHTRASRARRRKWPGQILQVSGDLAGSMTSAHDAFSAVAGTSLVYAPTHQFGAARGAFGATARGQPIPFGDIPARPFLGVSDETRQDILDALEDHLAKALI